MHHSIRIGLGALASLLVLAACKPNASEQVVDTAIDRANFDTTARPGDDFFRYANGGWMKAHPVPDEYTRYAAFDILYEQNLEQLKQLVHEAAQAKAAKGTEQQKIGDFYAAGMDTARIDSLGLSPIRATWQRIDAVKNLADLKLLHNQLAGQGQWTVFALFASIDKKNSQQMIAKTWQMGLTLPDRDYYLQKDNPRFESIRAAYLVHIEKAMALAGEPNPAKAAKTVLEFETEVAQVSNSRLQNRDPHATYNKRSVAELKTLAPNFDWDGLWTALGIGIDSLDISQPQHLQAVDALLAKKPIDTWKTLMKWQLLHRSADYLSSDIEQLHFDFFAKTLYGQEKMKPRWKRVLDNTSDALGEPLGKLYVAKHFPQASKDRMLQLVENLRKALAVRIEGLAWMSDSTKQQAKEKLAKITVKIGYPDKWRDYSGLNIEGSYYDMNQATGQFNQRFNLQKIGKPVDPTEWGMTPQTVNAYYSPNRNEIVFPAGILQPPFFYADADDAVNYGAIGVVIGHEISHGFDDQGRKYDQHGNLHDWWTAADATAFDQRTQLVVDHYNGFTVFDSLHVDGKLTLGENIADIGGLNISLAAYNMALQGKDTPADINGFSHLQRFFIAYAQVWRQNIRDKALMNRLKEDVHSPGEFRVNGALFHVDAFYDAFGIDQTAKLYLSPEKRSRIW